MQRPGVEKASERLAGARDARRHLPEIMSRGGVCYRIRRIRVVEHDFGSTRKARKLTEGCEDRVLGQVGRDAKPEYERAARIIEAIRQKAVAAMVGVLEGRP